LIGKAEILTNISPAHSALPAVCDSKRVRWHV